MVSATNSSLSLDAVPLPIAIRFKLYVEISSRSFLAAPILSFLGSCGYITSLCRTFPFSSKHASLQPVLKAGSKPKTRYPVNGLVISKFSKFSLNTSIAVSSDFSVNSLLTSLSIDGYINLFRASLIAFSTYSVTNDDGFLMILVFK